MPVDVDTLMRQKNEMKVLLQYLQRDGDLGAKAISEIAQLEAKQDKELE